ncbi:hypothetical protein CLU79DRAFT_718321 [Phycomyces nitens]|nr:hypothetical protein CLU79DRAFT_718321 [Phycomyces nitens]
MRVDLKSLWDIWTTADNIQEKYGCKQTFDFCKEFVRNNCEVILESASWVFSSRTCALETLKIDNLPEAVDEVIFFQAALSWRTAAMTRLFYELEGPGSKFTEDFEEDFIKRSPSYPEIATQDPDQPSYKEYLDRAKEIESTFSEMINCIRFSQMELTYLSDIVENVEAIINVKNIDCMLSKAYRYMAFKKEKYLSTDQRQRHIS